ncbi:hypothetical protein Marpi_1996 [Marinitoga piezophila KA3]|uniref:Uncharacterized protein n=1 Tax=Marinitoga piezophila (strain DSM 14283 / JCM 11233 / KA3) TaxID=443254 RepID=H2J702_MARPK|nr:MULTISPECIES: DUF501 domain-containing protein [Marinitoga]AEX86372.1 hypothetical protein Marpi_1996 [Marinitoga piezophila KA3]APT76766.1 hypothetical protein LN42_10560 [Marinitoga sp. 1137]
MDINSPTEKDLNIIEKQINRKPHKVIDIPKRCSYGYPIVIKSYPVKDNEPFPTLYWLTCPHLIKAVGKLESLGKIKKWEEELKNNEELLNSYLNAHKEEQEERLKILDNSTEEWIKNALKKVGIGGIRNFETIKCLHLHLASYLGGTPNPIGERVWREIEKEAECPNCICCLL